MPKKPLKPCSHPGCSELVEAGRCEKHKRQERKQYDNERGTAAQRGYNSRWQKARKAFLSANPLCVHCQEEGRLTPATVVDHRIPHKGNQKLFWDRGNWQPLCKPCHDRKTALEDSNFARKKSKI